MAEESNVPLVTPEKNEPDSRNMSKSFSGNSYSLKNGHSSHALRRRASIGSPHTGDASRRNSISTEKSDSAKVPHYLRASTGSCHDFCKYGIKHGFEEKSRKPLWKKIAKSSPSEMNFVQIMVSGEKKKEKVIKQNSSTDISGNSPDLRHSRDTKSSMEKLKTPLDAKTYSPKKNALSGSKTRLTKYKPLPTKKSISPDPPEIIKREIQLPSENFEAPTERGYSTDSKTSIKEKNKYHHSEKSSSPLKLKLVNGKHSSFSGSSDGRNGKREGNRDVETVRKMTASRASAKKALAPSAATLSPNFPLRTARKAVNLKLASPLKVHNKLRRAETKASNNEGVIEKTLYVIKTETENNGSKSTSDNHSIPSTSSSKSRAKSSSLSFHEEKDKKSKYIGKAQPVKENHKKTLRKNRVMIVSEEKHRSPVKLKFRSGKVVDLQSDNNSPQRLKFRRVRALGAEDGKSDLRRRIFAKGGLNDDASKDLSSEKIVLKHHDVQGKKDAQGLFNNVIEETASKLVKSRKSKVKALVGAFETVISLQETRLSSHSF
ncbi:hypothetical protein ACJIZ3_014703 [Penstemon smallii]|uniref:Calmodulin-binding domain-containing protein n=1 Tax=Penstemon smallii TaxID=265156 RepID=A0ABD3RUJ0_9LAMI